MSVWGESVCGCGVCGGVCCFIFMNICNDINLPVWILFASDSQMYPLKSRCAWHFMSFHLPRIK